MHEVSKAQQQYLTRLKRHHIFIIVMRVLLLLVFLLTWEYTAKYEIINSFIFSSPSKIYQCFINMIADGSLFTHVGITLYETIVSFVLVTIVSLGSATLLWFFPTLAEIFDPYIVIMNSLPKSALAPLLIVWLGATPKTIIIAGMSVAVFGSVLSLYTHFQSTDSNKIRLIYTLKGNRFHALTKVVIPSAIPCLLSVMKINIGLCLVGVVIGEFLAAKCGLGYLIIYSSQVFKMDWLLLSIVLLCIMAMLLYGAIQALEKWYHLRNNSSHPK